MIFNGILGLIHLLLTLTVESIPFDTDCNEEGHFCLGIRSINNFNSAFFFHMKDGDISDNCLRSGTCLLKIVGETSKDNKLIDWWVTVYDTPATQVVYFYVSDRPIRSNRLYTSMVASRMSSEPEGYSEFKNHYNFQIKLASSTTGTYHFEKMEPTSTLVPQLIFKFNSSFFIYTVDHLTDFSKPLYVHLYSYAFNNPMMLLDAQPPAPFFLFKPKDSVNDPRRHYSGINMTKPIDDYSTLTKLFPEWIRTTATPPVTTTTTMRPTIESIDDDHHTTKKPKKRKVYISSKILPWFLPLITLIIISLLVAIICITFPGVRDTTNYKCSSDCLLVCAKCCRECRDRHRARRSFRSR